MLRMCEIMDKPDTRPHALAEQIKIPAITAAEMQHIDDALMQLGYNLLQLMENAGAALSYLTTRYLTGDVSDKAITILAGHGHNGGGGLVAARRLHAYGAHIQVLMPAGPSKAVTIHQRKILAAMGVRVHDVSVLDEPSIQNIESADLLIDALVGYGLRDSLTGITADLVTTVNRTNIPVISLDVPSGLSSDGDAFYQPSIKAVATMTLALPKIGLLLPHVQNLVGRLFLADIGVPPNLYSTISLSVPAIFNGKPYVALNLLDR